ncbi:MAG TPA: chitobiase/beta-hexosaminidase C-terminal domain-containing protein, partial [Opitutaceae bacterium]|nr:chitobiase/beta-hexosaminidase C-terminal domain-containing protein [Opitutaceae bacterium]
GGSELTVGSNYAFRISDTTLNYWGAFVDTSANGGVGTVSVCNFSTGGTLPQAAAPVFSPAAGTYTNTQNVSITSATGGASIRYTTDGSTPSETAGTLYSGAVNISTTTTLKAIAYESGYTDSSITSATYTISAPTVSTPTFSPAGGTYSSAQNVTISDSTSGATIYYTTNCTTPTTSSTVYSGAIAVSSTTTIKALGVLSGDANSAVASATYTISLPQVATPSFSPAGGTYSSAQNVTISDSTGGASIRYTTDGSTPSETAGTLYSGPVNISTTTTLKAIAYESGLTDSSITSATYTISSGGGGGTLTGSSSDGFHNLAISPAATGTFTATFDATPTVSPENAVVGLSSGAATAYGNLACIARFNPTGQIDAYNGTAYAAASSINYSANVSYHFRLVVNTTAQTYSVYVTPAGGSELTVGSNYAFRSTAGAPTSLNNWCLDVNATPAGCSLTAINLSAGAPPVTFTITASAGANGSISPSGSVVVNQGTNQSFTITANSGFSVSSVTVDGASQGAITSYTFSNVQANHTISATFASVPTFTITASAGANGSISPSGSVSVTQGASKSFSITANSGFVVSSVTVDGASQGAITSYTFSNVQANHTISATFAPVPTFTITASAGANGSISPSGTVTVNQGASQSFTITPNSGFKVSSVTVDGASQGAITSYTFSNVQANHTISAAFTQITYTITASAGSNGSISPLGAVTVNSGASQSFTITPSSGFNVSSVTVDGANQGAVTSYTFSNVQANHTISATFASSSGLNPNVPPGQNFNLSNWELDLPTGSNGSIDIITQPQLATFTNAYFYTDPNDGAMTFFCPENGVHTTNSSFPRSELRELDPSGDWPLTGTNIETATLKVEDTLAHVAIGQIHIGNGGTPTSTKPLLELFYYSTGQITLLLETSPSGGGPETNVTTVPLGQKFSYTIKTVGNALTIIVNGVTQNYTINSSYNSERFYFKAGDYLQTTGTSSTVGAHVAFYALNVTHQ